MNIWTNNGVPLNKYEYPYANLLTKMFLCNLNSAKNKPINNPTIKETDKSFKVITAALINFGKLLDINSKSISTPCYTLLLIY